MTASAISDRYGHERLAVLLQAIRLMRCRVSAARAASTGALTWQDASHVVPTASLASKNSLALAK
jgi:hypothetical protein